MKAAVRLAAAVVTAAGVFLVYQWWGSDERAVKNRLTEAAAILSVAADDGDVSRLARMARLRAYLAEDVHVRTDETPEIASRGALLALIARWSPPPRGVAIELVDMNVTLVSPASRARVHLTAKLVSHDSRTGEPIVDAREATVTMIKPHGEWVVSAIEANPTLQR